MIIVYEQESYLIMGACFEVYKDKGRKLRCEFQSDFISFGKIVVELKAVPDLNDQHRAQVHNYLKATGHKLGLLVNFGHHPGVEYERIVR